MSPCFEKTPEWCRARRCQPDERLQFWKMTIKKNSFSRILVGSCASDRELLSREEQHFRSQFSVGYSTKSRLRRLMFSAGRRFQFERAEFEEFEDYYARWCISARDECRLPNDFRRSRSQGTINQLMSSEIDKRGIEAKFGIDFEEYFALDTPNIWLYWRRTLKMADKKSKNYGRVAFWLQRSKCALMRIWKTMWVFSKTV